MSSGNGHQGAEGVRCDFCRDDVTIEGEAALMDHIAIVHLSYTRHKCDSCGLDYAVDSTMVEHSRDSGHRVTLNKEPVDVVKERMLKMAFDLCIEKHRESQKRVTNEEWESLDFSIATERGPEFDSINLEETTPSEHPGDEFTAVEANITELPTTVGAKRGTKRNLPQPAAPSPLVKRMKGRKITNEHVCQLCHEEVAGTLRVKKTHVTEKHAEVTLKCTMEGCGYQVTGLYRSAFAELTAHKNREYRQKKGQFSAEREKERYQRMAEEKKHELDRTTAECFPCYIGYMQQ